MCGAEAEGKAELAALALSHPLPCLKPYGNFAWGTAGRQGEEYFSWEKWCWKEDEARQANVLTLWLKSFQFCLRHKEERSFSHPQPCGWVNEVVVCCFGKSLWCLGDFPCVIITGIFYNPKDEAEPAMNQVAKRNPNAGRCCGGLQTFSTMPRTRSC